MSICDSCHNVTKPGDRMTCVVVETRSVVYPARDLPPVNGESRFDRGGKGTEIVREEARCPECAS